MELLQGANKIVPQRLSFVLLSVMYATAASRGLNICTRGFKHMHTHTGTHTQCCKHTKQYILSLFYLFTLKRPFNFKTG